MQNEVTSKRFSKIGFALGLSLLSFVLLVPFFSTFDADFQDPARKLLPPNAENLLGTDQFGRDLLTRVAEGGRRSLGAALIVLLVTLAVSIFSGIALSLVGGAVDAVFSRMIDALLAMPQIVLALAIVGVLGVGFGNLLIAVVISSLAYYTRLARGFALAARRRPDVTTARLAGIGWRRVIMTHVSPGVFRQMLVVATLDLGGIIVNLAALSFLGLGAQPPQSEWGSMLNESRLYFLNAPHLLLVPGAAILVAVVSANLIGLSLRDRHQLQ